MTNESVDLTIRISNTILYCHKWHETVHFYKDLLKFKQRFAREDWFVEFQVTPTSCLGLADAARCSIDPAHGVGITLSFNVENLHSLHHYFKELQLSPTEVVRNSWRAPYFYIHDPEGSRIEFWSYEEVE